MKPLKKRNIYISIVVIICTGFYILQAIEPLPPYHHPRYRPESWRGNLFNSTYPQEAQPDTGLYAMVSVDVSEPACGYPMYSGIVKGVSDTIVIIVSFYNHNSEDYDISCYTPENWFTPVVYEIDADPYTATPLPLPANFGFSFQYWRDWFNNIITQPTHIPYSGDDNLRYNLIYYAWGLPAGRFRIMMGETDYAPDDFRLLLRYAIPVWIVNPAHLADTLNAYTACFWRAAEYSYYTQALAWTDSILYLNPKSIVGYWLKSKVYGSLKDTSSAISACDSVIAIATRYGDSVLPDSTTMNIYQRAWYDDMLMWIKISRWMFLTDEELIFR